MGMFDVVLFICPNCGQKSIEAQSKGGNCTLAHFESQSVDVEVAGGCMGDTVYCDNDQCKSKFTVAGPVKIALHLIPIVE